MIKKDLAEQFIAIHPLYYDKAKNWWMWNYQQFKWELIDETDILNAISGDTTANTINSKEKNEILESLKQVARLYKPEEVKPTWIQFKDTIVDIVTGQRFKASSQYFVTNPIPWELHQDLYENTPKMDEVFEQWVGKENVRTLYEILAYCLIPDYPIHRLFCFIGGGMNGKSCFLNLLKKFIGESNCTSTELDTLLNSRFEVTRLHKKLVCLMGETNFSEMNKTSILKKLTGGDLIGFEYKNKNPFEEVSYAKIIIATNNLPTTTDKTIGFYRRWMIIDFPNQFSEKKDILMDIPDEEYKSLALKCLVILKELLERREFTNEGSIEDRQKKYEEKSDPLEKFLREFTDEDANGYIFKHDFEKALNQWCQENRHRQMSEVVIGKKMKEKGVQQVQKWADWMSGGNNKGARAWSGIKWKEVNQQDKQDKQVTYNSFTHMKIS